MATAATKASKDTRADNPEDFMEDPIRRPAPPGAQTNILPLQRSAGNRVVSQLLRPGTGKPQPNQSKVPPIVEDVLTSGSGQPLNPGTRAFMESRFGEDFSQVRVHTGSRAAESAQAVNASAYTLGRDVVFAAAQYQPETTAGRRVLAHEMAHVIQQSRGGGSAPAPLRGSSLEQAAEQAASAATHGVGFVQVSGASATGLARQPRSLGQSLDPSALSDDELKREIALVQQWLQENPAPSSERDQLLRVLFAMRLHAANRRVVGYQRSAVPGLGVAARLVEMAQGPPRSSPVSALLSPPPRTPSAPGAQFAKPEEMTNLLVLMGHLPGLKMPVKISQAAAGFTNGFLQGAVLSIRLEDFSNLDAELSEFGNRLLFNLGVFLGTTVGLIKDLKDNVVALAELSVLPVMQAYRSIQEAVRFARDRSGYLERELDKLKGLGEFLYHLETDPGFLLQEGESLGRAVGVEAGSWFTKEFMAMTPFHKGMTVGGLVGYVAMEVLLFLLPPKWIVAGARVAGAAAKASRLGRAILPVLERAPGIGRMIAAERLFEARTAARAGERVGAAAGIGGEAAKVGEAAGEAGTKVEKLQAAAPPHGPQPPQVEAAVTPQPPMQTVTRPKTAPPSRVGLPPTTRTAPPGKTAPPRTPPRRQPFGGDPHFRRGVLEEFAERSPEDVKGALPELKGPQRLEPSVSSGESIATARQAGIPDRLYGDGTVLTRSDFAAVLPDRPAAVGRPAPPQLLAEGRPVSLSQIQNIDVQEDIGLLLEAGADPASIRVNQTQVIEGIRAGTNRPDLYAELKGWRIHIEYDRAPGTRAMEHARRILFNDPDAIVILKIVDFE